MGPNVGHDSVNRGDDVRLGQSFQGIPEVVLGRLVGRLGLSNGLLGPGDGEPGPFEVRLGALQLGKLTPVGSLALEQFLVVALVFGQGDQLL